MSIFDNLKTLTAAWTNGINFKQIYNILKLENLFLKSDNKFT